MVKKHILNKLKRFRQLLEKEGISVEKLILYGSHARGTARRDSDIDVCVVSKNFGKDIIEERCYLFHQAPKIDARIEPIAFSLHDYETNRLSPILHEIQKTGIEI